MTHRAPAEADGPPPRIAYILKMFPRFSETFILAELLELERTGVDLRIVSLKRPNDARRHADVERVRAPVRYLPLDRTADIGGMLAGHVRSFRAAPGRYLRTLGSAVTRRRWGAIRRFVQAGAVADGLRSEGVTHIHAHFGSSATSVALFASGLTGIPYSFTAHAKDIYTDSVSLVALRRKLGGARFVVTVSDFNASHLATIASSATIHRIYNGLDLDLFRLPDRPSRRPGRDPLVLGVGRLVEKKGFDDLIRAVATLRDRGQPVRCRIIGSGTDEARLRTQIGDLGGADRVTLDGPMPREELLALYPQADLFVAPCVVAADGNRDGLPTVLIEAMALGVPVVSTLVTGIPELVRDGVTGTLVPPADPTALADAIATTLADPVRSGSMADAGRRLVEERFDLRTNVAGLRRLFSGQPLARTPAVTPPTAPPVRRAADRTPFRATIVLPEPGAADPIGVSVADRSPQGA